MRGALEFFNAYLVNYTHRMQEYTITLLNMAHTHTRYREWNGLEKHWPHGLVKE